MARRRWSFWMPPLEHRVILLLDDLYRGRFTPEGRVLVWGAVVTGAILLGGLATPLALGFGFCLSGLVIAAAVGIFYRPKLRMRREIIAYPSAGDTCAYRVHVENIGQTTARSIVIEERGLPPELRPESEPPVIDALEPGERTSVTLHLKCHRRGAYDLMSLQGASSFPAGLFKSGAKLRQADRFLVYPQVTKFDSLDIPHGGNYQPGGIAVASQVGDSTEFIGTRDWRQGDRIRDIHWPSSARVGKLIAKEFREEYFVRLALVLDVEAQTLRSERQLEIAISIAAGIADVLCRMEYVVDIFAAGTDVYHFRAGRALAYFDNVLEVLACLESCQRMNRSALESVLLAEAERLSGAILVMSDWDAEREQMVQSLRAQGLSVRVVLTRPGVIPSGLEPEELIEAPR